MQKKCYKCNKKVTEKNMAWYGEDPKTKKKDYWCLECADKFNAEIKKTLPIQEKIIIDVDDELYLLKKKIQKKYKLTWAKARDYVNNSIAHLCCECWNDMGLYGCGNNTRTKKALKK